MSDADGIHSTGGMSRMLIVNVIKVFIQGSLKKLPAKIYPLMDRNYNRDLKFGGVDDAPAGLR